MASGFNSTSLDGSAYSGKKQLLHFVFFSLQIKIENAAAYCYPHKYDLVVI
jgi:hypothetical protein